MHFSTSDDDVSVLVEVTAVLCVQVIKKKLNLAEHDKN
jgi:hypothetical protein